MAFAKKQEQRCQLDNTPTPDQWSLQRKCDFISNLYWLWVGGMTVVTLFRHGEDTVVEVAFQDAQPAPVGAFHRGAEEAGN